MWKVGNQPIESRLLLGTASYPSPGHIKEAILASGTHIVTVSVRRQAPEANGGHHFWKLLKELPVKVLPNTAGCKTAVQAVNIARMSRELFSTNWIKLEITGDDYNLQPDPFELLKAAQELVLDGFEVFPYTTNDLVVAQKLVQVGCNIVMPWAAPIGTGRGPVDLFSLEILRRRLPDIILIIDAGLGKPSHASQVMELGYDAVLLNSAVAHATEPKVMARAFSLAVEAGRLGFEAGLMETRSSAKPSTPVPGTPFWHNKLERVL
jgi:thiazole synthase